MYVKSLREIAIYSIGFNFKATHSLADFSTIPLTVRIEVFQWLADHNTGLLDPSISLQEQVQQYFVRTNLLLGLTSFVFVSSDIFCNELCQAIAENCSHIERLKIKYCERFSDRSIEILVPLLHRLQKLSILSNAFDGCSLASINSPLLQSFKLSNASINAQKLTNMLENCRNVSKIHLHRCTLQDSCHLYFIPTLLKDKLKCLMLPPQLRSEPLISELCQHCPNLEEIDFCSSKFSSGLKELADMCPNIKKLDISSCYDLVKDNNNLLNIPSKLLTELNLSGLPLMSSAIVKQALTRLQSLTVIGLSGVPCIATDKFIIEEICDEFGHQLKALDLSMNPSLPDTFLRPIAHHCACLEKLNLSFCSSITLESLRRFFEDDSKVQHLSYLALMQVKHVAFEMLELCVSKCYNLQSIYLDGLIEQVDDRIVECIANTCPKLARVGLKGCTKITDASIIYLSTQCQLKRISLAGLHELTNRSVISIARCSPTIEELYLSGCKLITEDAINYIKDQAIGRLYVGFRNPQYDSSSMLIYDLDSRSYVSVNVGTGVAPNF